ncbi:hypothetical protein WS75_25390 [Burkholderia sp. FL-7-2-10-S1-D7]|nr:hypothetical protein WS75_25390 [Burkholderia sp. FL-7-2-10-S1-D7]
MPVPGQADCLLAASPGEVERYVIHIDVGTFDALRLGTSTDFPQPDSPDCDPRATVVGPRRQCDPGDDAQ